MADPTSAWHKAFAVGSKQMQDRLKKVHAKNPAFQNWLKSSGHESGSSVKQASKLQQSTTRVKELQKKSLAAYGATRGTRMGGSDDKDGPELRDTIAPLTRDQHSKVQSAERAMKAATKKPAKPAAPKKPLSKDDRMAIIRRAALKTRAKDRFDIPTVNPDDVTHDDLRDVHQSLHVRSTYSEEVELLDEAGKRAINITKADLDVVKSGDHETVKNHMAKLISRAADTKTNARPLRADKAKEFLDKIHGSVNVGQLQKMAYNMYLGGDDEGKSKYGSLHVYKPKSAMGQSYQKRYGIGEDTEPSDKEVKMARGIAFDKRYKGGNMTGASNAIEKIRPGLTKHPKVAAALRSANEETEMSYGKKIAKIMLAKQSKHAIAQNMGEAKDPGEYDYEGDMAMSQLKSVITNAQKLHDMLEPDTNLPEWVQSKITLAEDYIVTAANYMQSQTNEEVEQVDEKMNLATAKMGDVVKDFYKSKAPQFAGKSMEKRREMAVAAKLGAEREAKNEEAEQIDEASKFKVLSPEERKAAQDHWKKNVHPVYKEHGLSPKFAKAVDAHVKVHGPHQVYNFHGDADGNYPRWFNTNKYRVKPLRKKTGYEIDESWVVAEEVVTEAEGTVAVTPKEKALAAHHGDPKKITFGDVIKARLKSAAAKKMSK